MSHYPQCIDPRVLTLPTNALLHPTASFPMSFAPSPSPTSSVGTLAPPPQAHLRVEKSASSSSSTTAFSAASDAPVQSAHQQHERRDQRKVHNMSWRGWRAILPKPSSSTRETETRVGERATTRPTTHTTGVVVGQANHGARASHAIVMGWQPEDGQGGSVVDTSAHSTVPTPSSSSARQDTINEAALRQYSLLQLRARQAEAELEREGRRAQHRREAEDTIEEYEHTHDVVGSEQGRPTLRSPVVQMQQPHQIWEDVWAYAQETSSVPTGCDFMHLAGEAATMTNSAGTAAISSSSTARVIPQTLLQVPLIPLSLALADPAIRRHPEQYEIDEARLWFDLAQLEVRLRIEQEQREAREAHDRAERERRERAIWEERREAKRRREREERKRREREERKRREVLRAYREGRRAMGGGRVTAPASAVAITAQQANIRVNATVTSSYGGGRGSGIAKPRATTPEEREAARVETERKARAQELAKRAGEMTNSESQRPALAPSAAPSPRSSASNTPMPEPIAHDINSVLESLNVQYGGGAFLCSEADVELDFSDGYIAFRDKGDEEGPWACATLEVLAEDVKESGAEEKELEREMMEELERMFGLEYAVL